ncbi:MAG: 50S ribosomal protein L11 methyltransferase [bacterium]|nr:50S ribosomal protein L11 methyltransferase [bacterium]MDI1334823.1 50S ribosomal protein L11 methyltransferase [Lacunisphaera sp.]
MATFELKIEVTGEAALLLEERLADYGDVRLMMLEDKVSGRAWLAGYFESRADAVAAWKKLAGADSALWVGAEPLVRELPEEDWKNSYKAHFKAWKFGRLNWVPVWERETFQLPAGEQVLWLDPGMAFGTGNHETTRLVVERLVALAERHGTGGRVIDAGCGSGILALSAAKLGYQTIAAFDNDPLAIDVSKENAELNGLGGRVDHYVGDLVTGLTGRQAELVLANIQADVLMKFARELCAAVAPGGALVLSGILAQENAQVRAVFAAMPPGWETDSRVMGEWSDLVVTRSA